MRTRRPHTRERTGICIPLSLKHWRQLPSGIVNQYPLVADYHTSGQQRLACCASPSLRSLGPLSLTCPAHDGPSDPIHIARRGASFYTAPSDKPVCLCRVPMIPAQRLPQTNVAMGAPVGWPKDGYKWLDIRTHSPRHPLQLNLLAHPPVEHGKHYQQSPKERLAGSRLAGPHAICPDLPRGIRHRWCNGLWRPGLCGLLDGHPPAVRARLQRHRGVQERLAQAEAASP